ncbi:hypothetical protein GCM10010191_95920 [Actinomadura vinacea]|uniref:Uncharacterized protein n=1 Tax=Actinomadura vinacea TaxID=115336 RepID=A0ABN3KHM6_9ACTN
MALKWLGDREGACQAFVEALRRDPWDQIARHQLEDLGGAPSEEPPPDPVWRRPYGFALLRAEVRVSNSDWDTYAWLFDSVPSACAWGDHVVGAYWEGTELESFKDLLHLEVELRAPGAAIVTHEVTGRIVRTGTRAFIIDWKSVPLPEEIASPLPAGRPIRVGGSTYFF